MTPATLLAVGLGALLFSAALAAAVARRPSVLRWQIFAGVLLAAIAWKVAAAAGAFEDENPESCSDCGEGELAGLILLVGNAVGWSVGALLGGLGRYAVLRPRAR